MNEWKYQIRYALPLWLIALLTEWLPENRISQSLRGTLIGRVVGARSSLRVARGVNLVNVRDLAIGEGVYLGPYVWVNALGGVVIEDDVMLGPFVCIATTTHGFAAGSVRAGGVHLAAVRIGRGSWLGAHATVAAGVEVGSGNLVGANSVVTKSTPPDVKVGGVPARILGKRGDNPGRVVRRGDV